MAKLSTPSHPCEQAFAPTTSGAGHKCGRDAYRRFGGKGGPWLCRSCTRTAKARAERAVASGDAMAVMTFEVIGEYNGPC